MLDKYSDLKQKLSQLFDRTTLDAIALLLSESEPERITPDPLPDWMTASQGGHIQRPLQQSDIDRQV